MKLNLCSFTYYVGNQLFILNKFPSTTLSQALQTQKTCGNNIEKVRRFEMGKKGGIKQNSGKGTAATPCPV